MFKNIKFGQFKIILVVASMFVVFCLSLSAALAAEGDTNQNVGGLNAIKRGVDNTAGSAQLKSAEGVTLESVVGSVINSALSLVGMVLFGYLLYGGYKYMTAAGDSTAVTKALGILRNAIIGIVIISMAYVATNYVLDQLILAQGTTEQVPATQ